MAFWNDIVFCKISRVFLFEAVSLTNAFLNVWFLDQIRCRCSKSKAGPLQISSSLELAAKFVAQVFFFFSPVASRAPPRTGWGALGWSRKGKKEGGVWRRRASC